MNSIILISSLIFLLSFSFTLIFRYFAIKRKLLDIPNERSSHLLPTPKGGGVAFVFSWFLGISVLFYLDFVPANLYLALLSGLLLAVISFIDDIIDLNPVIRLITQVFTAIMALIFLGGIKPLGVYGFQIDSIIILYPAVIIGIVWFINLFNFLDGIDGYASLEASLMAIALYILTGNVICLIFLACVLGFLSWNWPKAKIFMGDVGSTQLGFILVILGIYLNNESDLSIIHWIMLSSLFWFDATITLYRRWRNRESLSIAHKKHAYQRIVQSGYSHQKTIILSFFINLVIFGLVLLSIRKPILIIPMLFIDIFLLFGITYLIDRKTPFK